MPNDACHGYLYVDWELAVTVVMGGVFMFLLAIMSFEAAFRTCLPLTSARALPAVITSRHRHLRWVPQFAHFTRIFDDTSFAWENLVPVLQDLVLAIRRGTTNLSTRAYCTDRVAIPDTASCVGTPTPCKADITPIPYSGSTRSMKKYSCHRNGNCLQCQKMQNVDSEPIQSRVLLGGFRAISTLADACNTHPPEGIRGREEEGGQGGNSPDPCNSLLITEHVILSRRSTGPTSNRSTTVSAVNTFVTYISEVFGIPYPHPAIFFKHILPNPTPLNLSLPKR